MTATLLMMLQAAAVVSVLGVLGYGLDPLAIIQGIKPSPAATRVVHLPDVQSGDREVGAQEGGDRPEGQATLEPTATATASAIATATATREASPTASASLAPTTTQTPLSSATPTRLPSLVPTATHTPVPTQTLAPTATATASPPNALVSPTPTPQQPEGELRKISLGGALEALQREGEFVWSAIGIDCADSAGAWLGRLDLDAVEGEYLLPAGTKLVSLWIGPELDGHKWWSFWDSQPVSAANLEITLVIRRIGLPTATNAPSPMPSPTCTCEASSSMESRYSQ